MSVTTRAVLTAVVAALVAAAASLGELPLVLVAGLLVLVVAVGWPPLAGTPAPRGASVVVGLGGLGGLVAVVLTEGQPHLRELPEVLALAVLLAFVRELVRRDGRERLLESVAGTVSGVMVAATVTGWVAAGRTEGGVALVLTGAIALAVASAVSAVPLAGWVHAAVTTVAAVAAGVVVAVVVPDVDPLPGGVIGLAIGVLVATLHRLFERLPSLGGRWPALAATVLPVLVTGVLVYVVGRVLVA